MYHQVIVQLVNVVKFDIRYPSNRQSITNEIRHWNLCIRRDQKQDNEREQTDY